MNAGSDTDPLTPEVAVQFTTLTDAYGGDLYIKADAVTAVADPFDWYADDQPFSPNAHLGMGLDEHYVIETPEQVLRKINATAW